MSYRASFLPEDYLAQKAEMRTNVASLVLFAVVMLCVFLAFMVTNRKWTQVKDQQMSINERYLDAAEQIETLTRLQSQQEELTHKAELAAALVDRVPRSILLAEIVNRMPERLSLLAFELESEKIKTPARGTDAPSDEKTGRLAPKRGKTKGQAAQASAEPIRLRPPDYRVDVIRVGLAPSDLEVSRFLAALNSYPLFEQVNLEYSEERDLENQLMREFRIATRLVAGADVRDVEPLIKIRRDPMANDEAGGFAAALDGSQQP